MEAGEAKVVGTPGPSASGEAEAAGDPPPPEECDSPRNPGEVDDDQDTVPGLSLPPLVTYNAKLSQLEKDSLKAQLKEQHAQSIKNMSEQALNEQQELRDKLAAARARFVEAGGQLDSSGNIPKVDPALAKDGNGEKKKSPKELLAQQLKEEHEKHLREMAERSFAEKRKMQERMAAENQKLRAQLDKLKQDKEDMERLVEHEKQKRKEKKDQQSASHKDLMETLKSFQLNLAVSLQTSAAPLPEELQDYAARLLQDNHVHLHNDVMSPIAPAPALGPLGAPKYSVPPPLVLQPVPETAEELPSTVTPSGVHKPAMPKLDTSNMFGALAGEDDDPPDDQEIAEYARYLGMDVEADRELLYIAELASRAPMAEGWEEHEDASGTTFYFHVATGVSTYEHPMDEHYRQLYRDKKAAREKAKAGK